jgi:uncharacterized protein YggU (UPF0235/DUF167 family)
VRERATTAALAAFAAALGIEVRDVVLVSGATSRTTSVNVPDSAVPLVAGLRDG